MDEKFRESMFEVYEHHKQRVLNAVDDEEATKATADWTKAADLILRFDTESDTHNENSEKIIISQENEEFKRTFDQANEKFRREQDLKNNRRNFWLDFGIKGGGLLLALGTTIMAFYFDGKGVIFTSTPGKKLISSIVGKSDRFI